MSPDDKVTPEGETPQDATHDTATGVTTDEVREPAAETDAPEAAEIRSSNGAEHRPPPETAERPRPAESESAPEPSEQQPEGKAAAETGDTVAEQPAAEAEPPRKRPRLNPTIGADAARAVPNVSPADQPASVSPQPSSTEPPPKPTREITEAASSEESPSEDGAEAEPPAGKDPSATKPAPREAIEVPRKTELDADLEAEIAAAMSADEQTEKDRAAALAAAEEAQADDEHAEGEAGGPDVPVTEETLEKGSRLTGKIASIHGDDVFLELGLRSNGVVARRQFQPNHPPEVGQLIQVVVDKIDPDEGLIHCSLPRGTRRVGGDWSQLEVGQVVECYVNKPNKGGLEIAVSGIRGFLPASQIDLRFVEDTEAFVGQKIRVQVMEVNPKKRNLVVSRREILLAEREEAEKELWKSISKGDTRSGVVKTIKPYGAFVDIGGADGFLHVGEISWNRIKDPSEVLQVGQRIDVQVLKLDPEAKKISLGLKQLVRNPWSDVEARFPQGTTVSGRVTRTTDFGAFVELDEGIEGLVHISELDHARVRRVTDVLKPGQEVEAKVLDVSGNRRRISLSLKALKDSPEAAKDEDAAPGGEAYERKRKGPLKGGTGTDTAGGGLFGNPNDFS